MALQHGSYNNTTPCSGTKQDEVSSIGGRDGSAVMIGLMYLRPTGGG